MEIKFLKKEKKFQKENLRLSINFYWKISVFVMLVATLASFVFGYYSFTKINKELVFHTDRTREQAEKSRKDKVNEVLEYFFLRQEKSDHIFSSPSSIVDPSL